MPTDRACQDSISGRNDAHALRACGGTTATVPTDPHEPTSQRKGEFRANSMNFLGGISEFGLPALNHGRHGQGCDRDTAAR
jgi:hypothetical protein